MPTMMTRTTVPHGETLLLALDLGNRTWKLGFTVASGYEAGREGFGCIVRSPRGV